MFSETSDNATALFVVVECKFCCFRPYVDVVDCDEKKGCDVVYDYDEEKPVLVWDIVAHILVLNGNKIGNE